MRLALHWFRRDLRLHDNTALHAATTWADVVLPVFIFDPETLKTPVTGAARAAYLLETVRVLQADLEKQGAGLVLRRGKGLTEIRRLLGEVRPDALFFNREYEPGTRSRDEAVEKEARSLGIEVHTFKDDMIFEPDEVLKSDGQPYGVFTPYQRVWRTKTLPPVLPRARLRLPPADRVPGSEPLPSLGDLKLQLDHPMIPAGEAAAAADLRHFSSGALLQYGGGRNFPGREGTSRLSPHLRFGTISPRTVLQAVARIDQEHPAARRETEVFVGEITWRDFYRQILWYHPHVAESCFKPEYDSLKWENDPRLFRAWCEGRTGYPIVDAGMRQLNTTGWIHNRLRMIVAAFLTKDLLVSWQWGEAYFMEKLFDGDLASNNGGWQWSAGTGTDAQPYFRIFNPTAQAEKFDPEGRFIHRFVPEVETAAYPAPIVDHAQQRIRALAFYQQANPARA